MDTASEQDMEDPEVHTYTLQASRAPVHLRSPREQEVEVWNSCGSVPMGWSAEGFPSLSLETQELREMVLYLISSAVTLGAIK